LYNSWIVCKLTGTNVNRNATFLALVRQLGVTVLTPLYSVMQHCIAAGLLSSDSSVDTVSALKAVLPGSIKQWFTVELTLRDELQMAEWRTVSCLVKRKIIGKCKISVIPLINVLMAQGK
jgi:hypothetical protein